MSGLCLESMGLQGKIALVTGASRGIGYAVSHMLAEAGACVVGTARDGSTLERAFESIAKDTDGKCVAIEFDHTYWQRSQELGKQVRQHVSHVDILINNAGSGRSTELNAMTDQEWIETQAVNLSTPMALCREFAPDMLTQGWGRIVNVGSFVGVVGKESRAAYCSSKGGLLALTKALAIEYAPLGILVNAVAPGPARTALMERIWQDPVRRQAFTDLVPMNRWAEVEEIARPIVFLASDAASYITGQVLAVDGGITTQ